MFSTQQLIIKIYQDLLLKNGLKFTTLKEKNYNPNKEIKIKGSILRSNLCDFSDAYIVVEGDITLEGDNNANKRNKNLAFKDNAPFINHISKINGIKIDKAKDLDVAMLINTEKQQDVCEIITEMNQVILFLLILNLLNTRQALSEKDHKTMIH